MAENSVQVSAKSGIDGNTYTTSISNDKLTNKDFLKLMITELKLQDPTKPMDSARMLSTQMQMSSIETNLQTIKTMKSLQHTFTQSALSNASSMIGKNIEDGEKSQNGVNKAYTVRSIEKTKKGIYLKVQEILFLKDNVLDENKKLISYNIKGEILDKEGKATGYKVALKNTGVVLKKDGKPIILDKDNKQVTNSKYTFSGQVTAVYSNKLSSIPYDKITKIF